jgi:hypothetical protein
MSEQPWVTYGEGPVAGAKELVRTLSQAGIEAQLGPAPKKACCGGGGCGCGGKVQVLLRPDDVERAQALMRDEWMEAVKAEGTLQDGLPVAAAAPVDAAAESDDLTCPACGTRAPLVEGACSDCGLQLE